MKTKLTALIAMLCLVLSICLGACSICQHQFDNACDATCNLCERTRNVGAHEYSEATCSTPETCKHCSATTGFLLDCTPLVDGNCSTPVTCENCGKELPHVAESHSYLLTYTTNQDGHLVGKSACESCGKQENYTVTIVFDTSLFVATNLTGHLNEPVLKYTGPNLTCFFSFDAGQSQDTYLEVFLYADDNCSGYFGSISGKNLTSSTMYISQNYNIGINVAVQSKQDVTVTVSIQPES